VRAVEAALELHDLVAAAEGPGHAQREEGGLGAARHEPHLLGARHRPDDFLGQLDDGLVEEHERGAVPGLALHRLHDRGMRVAEQHGPGAQQVVDVALAVGVPEVRAARVLDDELEAGGATVAAEKAPGQDAAGALEQILLTTHVDRR
jgi:hypothetical protein